MGLLNTVAEFAIMRSNPIVGGVLTIGKYFLNKTKETPEMFKGFKTYIGIIVAVAPTLASLFGYEVSAEGQTVLTENLNEIAVLIGGAIATYGRFKANPVATKK